MSTINDYKTIVNKTMISVENYGTLYVCNKQEEKCGLCFNSWNYQHEYMYIQQIKKILPMGSIGIDIGAHTGTYSIALKDYITKMYSFEPFKYVYDALCLNAGLYPNIIPFNLACGDLFGMDNSVEVIHLDEFMCGKVNPNFIKIDVEGQEVKILNGMQKIISKQKEMVMLIEFDMKHLIACGEDEKSFFAALKNTGLDCDQLFEEVIKPQFKQNYFANILIHKKDKEIVSTILVHYYN